MLDMNKLGVRIIAARQRQGFTQEELGEKLGVSAQAVSKWERGVSLPDTAILPDMARVLKTGLDALMEINDGAAAETPEALPDEALREGRFGPFMSKAHAFDEVRVCAGIALFRYDGIYTAFDVLLENIPRMRRQVYQNTGIVLPIVRIMDQTDPPLGDGAEILFRGHAVWRGTFNPAESYDDDRAHWDRLVKAEAAIKPETVRQNGSPGYTPPAAEPSAADTPVVRWMYQVLRALLDVVNTQLTVINTFDHTARLIEAVRTHHPATVEAVIPAYYTIPTLRVIFNNLLTRGASLRDLLSILELLWAFKSATPDGGPEDAAEYVMRELPHSTQSMRV